MPASTRRKKNNNQKAAQSSPTVAHDDTNVVTPSKRKSAATSGDSQKKSKQSTNRYFYFEHKNDYWTQRQMQSGCADKSIVDLWDSGAPARHLNGTGYEEDLFFNRVSSVVAQHDPAESVMERAVHDLDDGVADDLDLFEALLVKLLISGVLVDVENVDLVAASHL